MKYLTMGSKMILAGVFMIVAAVFIMKQLVIPSCIASALCILFLTFSVIDKPINDDDFDF
jgi:hypothetical protein